MIPAKKNPTPGRGVLVIFMFIFRRDEDLVSRICLKGSRVQGLEDARVQEFEGSRAQRGLGRIGIR